MRVVDNKGNELKKVICPSCKGLGYQGTTEKKSPGVTHTDYLVCKKCHACGWIWEKKK